MNSHANGSDGMTEPSALDGRPPRRGEDITSASGHPELLSGDLALPPRPRVSITSINRSMASSRVPRAWGGVFAIAAIITLLSAMTITQGTSDDIAAEQQRLARACIQWHLAAGAVVSRLVQSTRDADLVQVSELVARMRRARRHCEVGWFALACQDYHAVAAHTPGTVLASQLFSCAQFANSSYYRD